MTDKTLRDRLNLDHEIDTLINAGPGQYAFEIANLRRTEGGLALDLLVTLLDRLRDER